MLIAETQAVRDAYPAVRQEAVDHLLHALHRAVPLLETGRVPEAIDGLRRDLAAYRGSLDDFEALGVRAIFTAAGLGRHNLANQLGELRLLRPVAGAPRYVIVGDALAARMWARQRRIGLSQILAVRRRDDAGRLAGLDPRRAVIVALQAPRHPELAQALEELRRAGAAVRDGTWRPGDVVYRVPALPPDTATGPPPLDLAGDEGPR